MDTDVIIYTIAGAIGGTLLLILLIILISLLKVNSAFKKLDAQLKRRYEIIPEFMNMVYDSVLQGQSTLAAVTNLRNSLANNMSRLEYFKTNAQLSDEIGRLMFTINNYPELKIKDNFNTLSDELNNIEKTIDTVRNTYNDRVRSYNNRVTKFPFKIFFFFKTKDIYETKYDRFNNGL